MPPRSRTAFDRCVGQRTREPTLAAEYGQARAEIDAVDTLIRALDQARQQSRLTKAALARRIHAKPEIVRRLLTDAGGNPTMATVLKLASAMDCHLELVPNSGRNSAKPGRSHGGFRLSGRRSRSADAAAASQHARLQAMSARDRILLALRLSRRFPPRRADS